MASGNVIVVSAEPRGRPMEGTISGSGLKPGTIMQLQANTAPVNGRHTYEVYDRAASGDRPVGPMIVLDCDWLQGKTPDDAYSSGDRCFLFEPVAGDELNVRIADVAGTGSASDFTIGEPLMVQDGTGLLIRATGTPQSAPFTPLENLVDQTSNALCHVVYSGV